MSIHGAQSSGRAARAAKLTCHITLMLIQLIILILLMFLLVAPVVRTQFRNVALASTATTNLV